MKIKLGTNNQRKGFLKDKKLLIIAIACGAIAMMANLAFLTKAAGTTVTILKAKEDIPLSAPVTRGMFDEITISGEREKLKMIFVEAANFNAFEKTSLAEPLKKDEPLLLHAFEGGVKVDVPPGKRFVPIKVQDEGQAVGYLIRPGNSVDIHGWIKGVQYKLAAKICVVAIGSLPYSPSEDAAHEVRYSSITVSVDQADVEHLNNNLHHAGEEVILTLAGNCDPNAGPEVLKSVVPAPVAQEPMPQPKASARKP